MSDSPEPVLSLMIGSGVCWSLAYILIIRRGFLDQTYGMPLVALGANLSWEFIFSVLHPHDPPQGYVNLIWLLLDLVILYQVIRFGQREFYPNLPAHWFYPALVLALLFSFGGVLFITYEFQDWSGKYAAFGQNLMMSVLFVQMLLQRDSPRGQSMYIALLKLIGTVLPSLAFFLLFPASFLLTYLYVAILVFDILYAVLLYRKIEQSGEQPWKRF